MFRKVGISIVLGAVFCGSLAWAEGHGKLNGAIDGLRIYIGALSPAEIQALYSAGTEP